MRRNPWGSHHANADQTFAMELLAVTRITQVEAEAREYPLESEPTPPPLIPCCQDVASNRVWYWHNIDDEKQISTVANLKMYLFFSFVLLSVPI